MGKLVAQSRTRALLVVGIWILLAGLVPRLTPTIDEVKQDSGSNSPPPSAESAEARDLLLEKFPDQDGVPAIIVLRNPDGLQPADEAEVKRISEALSGPNAPKGVSGVVSTATVPAPAAQALRSEDGTTTMILVPIRGLPSTDERFGETVGEIRDIAGPGQAGTEVRLTGPAGIATDASEVFRNADFILLGLTVLLVLFILLAIYRSPLLALIPLLGVGVALQLTNAVGAVLADAGIIKIDSQTASIMTVLLFGAGTDYALFVLMRFREELADTSDRYAAMRLALRKVGEPVISSGGTVILALFTLLLATVPATREFGSFLALGVFFVLLVSLTFVPAAVLLSGRAAFWPMKHAERIPSERSLWGRISALVLRRPGPVAAGTIAVLGALALGFLTYTPNANLVSDFRGDTDSLRGQQILTQSFPGGQLAPTTVLVSGGDPTAGATRVGAAIESVDGVSKVGQPTLSADGQVARLQVVYGDDPYGTPALDRTERVREVARAALPDGTVLVGGESANALDNRQGNLRDFIVVAVAMAVLILVVLVVLLRAVLAPLVLLITTALSLLSAVGATSLTWVALAGQAGTNDRVLLYCLIFLVALGVDYNILLASRIREEVTTHGYPNGIGVALTRTGGVITSAGVILAATFAVLMTQPLNSLLQFGFAMAVGIMLDTFLIRGALVPALFRLIGPRIWYPGRLSTSASASTPEPAMAER
ncbi:MMPL family transporter [Micromonospora polyrhachis]|uniref:RND superfamily putative drug exporter n=1 Tax=Micromonospora polyrhachis TaxID=1282883 RepID=A0A7W7STG5_9ACTN|nr:MMPL family transporter [Micromonospora polyrhachis]MBB4960682.1 RND superfamily putative drug exporter [Micromonospora polyrhachis]